MIFLREEVIFLPKHLLFFEDINTYISELMENIKLNDSCSSDYAQGYNDALFSVFVHIDYLKR